MAGKKSEMKEDNKRHFTKEGDVAKVFRIKKERADRLKVMADYEDRSERSMLEVIIDEAYDKRALKMSLQFNSSKYPKPKKQ